jgi:toxin ParE1/3/4
MIPDADIHPAASHELAESADFYERRSRGLGRRFLDSVERAIEQVLLFPESAPLVGRSVRQKTLAGFPFSLFYLYEKNLVFIVAVAHEKRAPMYWRARLQ